MNHHATLDAAAHLMATGHHTQAENTLVALVQTDATSSEAWAMLAQVSMTLGKFSQGMFAAWQANSLQASTAMQSCFADCLCQVAITAHDAQLQAALSRAMAETWGAPAALAEQAGKLIKLDPQIQALLKAYPNRPLTASDLLGLNGHALLLALLQSAPVCDFALESLFSALRKTVLLEPTLAAKLPQLCSSLAQQCFINEYIYPVSDAETAALNNLDHNEPLLILACYQPLHACAAADIWAQQRWPQPLQAVIQQQIIEPRAEAVLAAAMPAFTAVNDQVSQAVQAMYEESPYPRWVSTPKASAPQGLNEFLTQAYPLSHVQPLPADNPLQVLIAGGGTGQHPIHTAQRFSGAQVQVIDLSRRSLAYAQRKSEDMGLNNLKFAQADILQIDQLDQHFDLIESVGVLHHMGNPWAGWEALLTRLKPHGLMKLGFYSQTARQHINALRAFIKNQGFGDAPDDIRLCRQQLIQHSQEQHLDDIFLLRDFYSTSACRDLLFHVQEHQMTLPEIESFLTHHGLRFIGFETDDATRRSYQQAFPDDPAATNLANWHQFEQRHPQTFISMYQFWVQQTS